MNLLIKRISSLWYVLVDDLKRDLGTPGVSHVSLVDGIAATVFRLLDGPKGANSAAR